MIEYNHHVPADGFVLGPTGDRQAKLEELERRLYRSPLYRRLSNQHNGLPWALLDLAETHKVVACRKVYGARCQ